MTPIAQLLLGIGAVLAGASALLGVFFVAARRRERARDEAERRAERAALDLDHVPESLVVLLVVVRAAERSAIDARLQPGSLRGHDAWNTIVDELVVARAAPLAGVTISAPDGDLPSGHAERALAALRRRVRDSAVGFRDNAAVRTHGNEGLVVLALVMVARGALPPRPFADAAGLQSTMWRMFPLGQARLDEVSAGWIPASEGADLVESEVRETFPELRGLRPSTSTS